MSPRRSPGDGTVFKRASDNLWVAGFTINGKQHRATAKTRNAAIAKRNELKKKLDAGVKLGSGRMKLSKWLDHWLNIHKPNIDPRTYDSYAMTVRLYIKPNIGDKRLDKINPDDIRDMIAALQKQGSTRNAQKAYTVLRLALKAAVDDRALSWNPATVVGMPKHLKAEQQAFTAQVSRHILTTAIRQCDETWATRWATGFTTGQREGEVLGLTWNRVHLDTLRIDVSWQLQELNKQHGCGDPEDGEYPCGKVRVSRCPQSRWDFPIGFEHRVLERNLVLTRPKTKQGLRIIPILPGLATMLERLKHHDGPNPHNLVFHHPDGKPFTPSQDQKMWRALLQLAGLAHVNQHTMRRSTATLLMEEGVDAKVIAEILGHTDIVTTRGYQYVDLSVARAALEPLGQLLRGD